MRHFFTILLFASVFYITFSDYDVHQKAVIDTTQFERVTADTEPLSDGFGKTFIFKDLLYSIFVSVTIMIATSICITFRRERLSTFLLPVLYGSNFVIPRGF